MSAWFNTLQRLIKSGRTDGLDEKINNMYVYGQLSDEQYKSLMEELKKMEA